MAAVLPIILLAGGALLFAGKKKRRRKKSADYEFQEVSPTRPPASAQNTSGPSGKAASSEVWKARQTALAFVAGMNVCNSHPGNVDGAFGPATINAIIAFQICAGIDVDGKWGPQTDAAMKKMLAEIASGRVKVSMPSNLVLIRSEDDNKKWRDKPVGTSMIALGAADPKAGDDKVLSFAKQAAQNAPDVLFTVGQGALAASYVERQVEQGDLFMASLVERTAKGWVEKRLESTNSLLGLRATVANFIQQARG